MLKVRDLKIGPKIIEIGQSSALSVLIGGAQTNIVAGKPQGCVLDSTMYRAICVSISR